MMNKGEPESVKNKKRLWVNTELYYPEDNQTGYYLTRIAEGLAEDFNVGVICGQPNYAARGTRAAKREIHRGVEIRRVWGTTLDKDVLAWRLLNMLTLGLAMFIESIRLFRRGDVVLTVSAPPSLPFITALAAKIRRAEYTLIIQDKYPEILIAVGKSKPDSLFIKLFNHLNGRLYNGAAKIIVVGRDMAELVGGQTQSGFPNDKIVVIPNWAALEEVEPLPRTVSGLLEGLNILDKFVFLYAGNMGHPQDLETIVECAAELRQDERFHFVFIGSGVKKKWLEREVETKGLTNISVLPPRPRTEQSIFLNACDVGLVPLVKKMRGVAMPSRTYNLLAAGKPILALTEENSEVARVIAEEKVGWSVPPLDSENLLKMIRRIYEERDGMPSMSRRARRAALEKYSLETAVEKYREAFDEFNEK